MRTFDAELVNAIANAPGVPELFSVEAFDFTDALRNEETLFLLHDGALAIFEWSAPRVYQAHLIFGPYCRGRRALSAAAAIRDFMFEHHADMLWGQPPLARPQSCKLVRMLGFQHAGYGFHPIVGKTERLTCHRQS